jgi:hypothetical protein
MTFANGNPDSSLGQAQKKGGGVTYISHSHELDYHTLLFLSAITSPIQPLLFSTENVILV